jgi:hypothetical protein
MINDREKVFQGNLLHSAKGNIYREGKQMEEGKERERRVLKGEPDDDNTYPRAKIEVAVKWAPGSKPGPWGFLDVEISETDGKPFSEQQLKEMEDRAVAVAKRVKSIFDIGGLVGTR